MTRFLTILLFVLVPVSASAELYKYEGPDGEVVITTQKRSDLKLLEVVEGKTTRKKRVKKSHLKSAVPNKVARKNKVSKKRKHNAFDSIIREAGKQYNVPFAFVKAVIRVESAFNPSAVSHAGAMGLMQLMPRTAAAMNVKDPFDARQNIFGGTKFLRVLIDRYDGDINLILAAYNAGDAAVARYKGIPYPQTRGYVSSVFKWYRNYAAEDSGE